MAMAGPLLGPAFYSLPELKKNIFARFSGKGRHALQQDTYRCVTPQ